MFSPSPMSKLSLVPLSPLVKSPQSVLTCRLLVVLASPAMVWCSACVLVCRLSAGPAMPANTQPATSSPSASVPPAA